MKKMLIIDGNSIVNRAFYGIRPLTTKEGLHTNAIYGFVNILLKNLQSISPDYAAVAFDLKAPTFRHKQYAEYKAGRHAMPDELKMQMPYAHETAENLGFAVLEKEGYEADDILGTLAKMGEANGCEVYVLTGDKDSLQLISDTTKVLLAGNQDTLTFDRQKFFEKYTIQPEQFVDLKALMGDSSDNIPGVAGVGEKTAIKLIAAEGSLENLYDGIENKDYSASVKQKLINSKEMAFLSQFLARIERDAPIGVELSDIEYKGFDNKGLTDVFTKLEFFNFIKRLELTSNTESVEYKKTDDITALDKNKNYAIYKKNDILYIYSDSVQVCAELSDCYSFLADKDYKKIVYDVKQYYKEFAEKNIELNGVCFDVMLGAYLADSTLGSYDIEHLTSSYLNVIYEKDKTDNAQTVYKLYSVLMDNLEQSGMVKLMENIELPLAHTLSSMERRGFRIEREGLYKYGEALAAIAEELTGRIYFAAGCEFNINSPKQLGEVLFEKLGLPAVKKTKTGYSTNAEVLEKLRPYAPIVDDILEYRQVVKLKSTYVDGLLAVADRNGRVHTTFNQTGTATGRLSSTEPNLQNIPVRQEMGRELRRFFVPENENYVLVDADYSQIELRLLSHISGDETMINAFIDGVDIHTVTASQVFNTAIEFVTPEQRKRAKAVNFGIIYGMSDFSLATDIKVSKKQAGEYIQSYFEKYPKVDEYLKNTVEQAKLDGYVTTLYGRRRYIPDLKSGKAMLRKFGERVAMNSPIQGTAADIIKIAMVNTERALRESGIDAHLILQVHDELIVESNVNCMEKAKEILQREMENAVSLAVPLTVEIQSGKTWYECK
ncbi:MAG: DNA polymerase I [Ruminococcaceae bacterium]|nr:DNA polymerase I [Oscillospiraceae bacterium]